jgi:hypothetical protein
MNKSNLPSIEYMHNIQVNLKRNVRNSILSETDKYMTTDFPLDESSKQNIANFRQSLRDYFIRDDVINWKFTLENQQLPNFPDPPECIKHINIYKIIEDEEVNKKKTKYDTSQ